MTGAPETPECQGLVVKRYSGFYYVQSDTRILECKLRGKVKDGAILAGDRVRLTLTSHDSGIIEEVFPRTVELARPNIANVNQVLLVMSFRDPETNLQLLDRLLIMAEDAGLQSVIVLNKCDLQVNETADIVRDYYARIGYPVLLTSSKQNIGIDTLTAAMSGKITVIAGPSGVGKTSLLNLLVPGRKMKTGAISKKLGRGKHTTRHVELFPLPTGGWLADTPGFGVLDLPKMSKLDLRELFPEFDMPSKDCRFADCIHVGEKDCRVKDAVQSGDILKSRYQSYLTCLDEVMEKERCY